MTEKEKKSFPVNWRKRYRVLFLRIAFVLFWPGFAFAYLGGVNNQPGYIAASFALFTVAAILSILVKK